MTLRINEIHPYLGLNVCVGQVMFTQHMAQHSPKHVLTHAKFYNHTLSSQFLSDKSREWRENTTCTGSMVLKYCFELHYSKVM